MKYNDLLTVVIYQGRGMKKKLLSLLVLDVYSQFNLSIVKDRAHVGTCMIGSFVVCFMELIATFRPAHWSLSGDGVDLLRGIISSTVVASEWCNTNPTHVDSKLFCLW